MQYLLDTNTCIELMRNHPNVVEHMLTILPRDCFVSTITTYELHTGIAKCAVPDKERIKVNKLLSVVQECAFDQPAAREAGRLRGILESRGEMIGSYDLLIAAQALSSGLTVITANTSEFQRVPRLRLENWTQDF